MSTTTRKSKSAAASTTASAMTTPAQLERLGEHLRKLRLLKSGERLEALLQHAAAQELPYAEFLEQVLGEEVAAKTSKNIAIRTAMARLPFVPRWPLQTPPPVATQTPPAGRGDYDASAVFRASREAASFRR